MTLKAFSELVEEKSETEYAEWFDRLAKNEICIGGTFIRCFVMSKSRVAFRDATVYKVQEGNEIREYDKDADKVRQRMIDAYDRLDVMNRLALREYIDLLETKDYMERQLKKISELPEGTICCSFCGKEQDKVKKMVAGPNNVFICDDCIDICSEIMEEEMPDDERFSNPSSKS